MIIMEEISRALNRFAICTEDDDDIVCINQTSKLFSQAFATLNEIRRTGQLCDVVLHTEGRRLSAHKVVLSAVIPYFRSMFTTDMLEASQKDVHIHELEWETMEQLVNYAYTGELRISAGNFQSVMMGANFFNLEDVVEECSTFLHTRLTPCNVLAVRNFCSMLRCKSIVHVADRFIQKHFLAVAKSEEYLHLTVEDLEELLKWDQLNVESEEEVFDAAIRWVQFDPMRRIYAPRVLACVRLPLLKPSFLTDEVASHHMVKADLACRDLVDEAKDYHLIPERRSLLTSFRTKVRCCMDVPGLIFAIGGLAASNNSQSTVEMYDPLTGRWSPVRAMSTLRSRVGVAVYDRKVYAIGGFNGHDRLRIVEVFDYNKNEWSTVAPLAKKRSALGACFLNGKLYVIGGYDGITSLSTVEVYLPDRDIWEMGPTMSKQRSAAGVAVLDGSIYVMGGHDGMSIFNSVERYSPETGQWETVANMLTKRCRLGAATFAGKLYVCGGYDGTQFLSSAECYDPLENKWTPVTPMSVKRSRVSMAATANSLYAIAGYDGVSNLSSVEVYREDTDQWEFSPPMAAHEGGVGVGVVPIPPRML